MFRTNRDRSFLRMLSIAACVIGAMPAVRAESPPAPVVVSPAPVVLAGGYSVVAVTPEVRSAAGFAIHRKSLLTSQTLKLGKILLAEEQVVAGLNYRLTMRVIMPNGTIRRARVVVFRGLDGHFELNFWRWL